MTREIKFRAQTSNKDGTRGSFVYGFYFETHERPGRTESWIIDKENQKHLVYQDSVGQYTGLKDKNGVEIFDGDVVRLNGRYSAPVGLVEFKGAMWIIGGYHYEQETLHEYHAEVIGNIYENAALLPTPTTKDETLQANQK